MDTTSLDSALAQSLKLSLPGKKTAQSGSVALSRNNLLYPAGSIGSEGHILNIPSELSALVRAVHNNDATIERVYTVVSDPAFPISPVVMKMLADHSTRTGIAIHYTIRDTSGKILFDSVDVRDTIPFYQMPDITLTSVTERVLGSAKAKLDRSSDTSLELQLRKWALEGCKRNFPTREGSSSYGAAVLTASGNIYYGGQYSAFDQWTGVHAEMGVLSNVLMDGARDITHLGIVSSKFVDTPCSPCGSCRQFIAEMSRAYDFSPTICLFASASEQFLSYTIEELLPVQWTSKR